MSRCLTWICFTLKCVARSHYREGNCVGSAPAPSLGSALSMPPGGYAPDTGPSIYPEAAPSPLTQIPYMFPLASPGAAPAIAPVLAPLAGAPGPYQYQLSILPVGQPLFALPPLSGIIPGERCWCLRYTCLAMVGSFAIAAPTLLSVHLFRYAVSPEKPYINKIFFLRRVGRRLRRFTKCEYS